jgi:hypothetical protein
LSLPARSRLAILAFLLLAPIGGLFALDRAIAHATPFWAWVVASFPRRLDDSFLAEAVLRATPPGRDNVVLLGNSRADDGVDLAALESRFAARGLHFRNLTVVGSGPVDEAMRAREVAALEPDAVIAVVAASELRDADGSGETFSYDAAAARYIFPLADFAARPEFHLTGLAGELHVLARHRGSFQNAARVCLGRDTFLSIELELWRVARERLALDNEPKVPVEWLGRREPDPYPNDNTRAVEFLAETLHAAGTRLVMVEAPSHLIQEAPRVRPRVERFRDYMAELAAKHGFVFLPATRFPQLELDQFKDMVHVNESGRAIYTAKLGDELESLL